MTITKTIEVMAGTPTKTKTIVYFSHEGENVLEGFGNRRMRPVDLYKTYLGDVAEALGLPRTTKFSWSQKAGCGCGCSPGFITREGPRRTVWVTLSVETPKVEPGSEPIAKAITGNLISRVDETGGFAEQVALIKSTM